MSGSGISWAICKSARRSRQITTPAPYYSSFLQAGCPSCRPTNSVKALKAQSDPNHVSRLLLDCVPVFHKICTPAYLLYHSGPVAIYYSLFYHMFAGGAKIIVTPLTFLHVCHRLSTTHPHDRPTTIPLDEEYFHTL